MKKHLISVSLFLAVLTGIASAAEPSAASSPGQLASVSAPSITLLPSAGIISTRTPETTFLSPEIRHARNINRVWVASLLAVAASTSMDAATSFGKREGNGALASSDGTFGARGVGIKAGMLAAVVVPQLALRHHQKLKSKFAIGNFIEAGIFTGVSVHNLGVTAPR
jgi:hypothetical protein